MFYDSNNLFIVNYIKVMKIVLLLLTAGIILVSCEKQSYYYLQGDTSIFKYGDTLIYNSDQKSDTFLIVESRVSFKVWDNRTYIQQYDFTSYEITYNCPDSGTFECGPYSFTRYADRENIRFYFRDIDGNFEITNNSFNISIDNKTIRYVFMCEYPVPDILKDRDVKKVYYTHKYGVIAYELFTGELFKLDKRYID